MAIQKKHKTAATRRSPILRMATVVFVALAAGAALAGCGTAKAASEGTAPAATAARPATVEMPFDEQIQFNAKRMMEEGKRIFRFDNSPSSASEHCSCVHASSNA